MVQVDQIRFRQCVDVDHDECPDVRRSGPLGHGRWWAGSGQGTVAGQWLDCWSPAFGEVCDAIVNTASRALAYQGKRSSGICCASAVVGIDACAQEDDE